MKTWKLLIFIVFLSIPLLINCHTNSVHTSLYSRLVAHYQQNDPDSPYLRAITQHPDYFKYGSTLPDMQYVNIFKSTIQDLGEQIYEGSDHDLSLTYNPSVLGIPDPAGSNRTNSFGIDTHDPEGAFLFAQEFLNHAMRDGGNGSKYKKDVYTTETGSMELALALGYYAHLVEDIVGHNFWVPRLTALENLNELNVINSINDQANLDIPGVQSHYFIEISQDYRNGEEAAHDFRNTIWNFHIKSDQSEPESKEFLVNGSKWDKLNPALQAFYNCLTKFYTEHPELRKGNLISEEGFRNECHLWRFVNQFYPETLGYGSLSEGMADWVSSHVTSSEYSFEIGPIVWDFIEQIYIIPTVYSNVEATIEKEMGRSLQTLLGLARYDQAKALEIVKNNPLVINYSEFVRMIASPIYSDPDYFTKQNFAYYADLEMHYFSQIGPTGKLFQDWHPEWLPAYAWGVRAGLNGLLPGVLDKRTNVMIHDVYLRSEDKRCPVGKRVSIKHLPLEVWVELFAPEKIENSIKIKGKVILEGKNGNDLELKTRSISFKQDPYKYNSTSRAVLKFKIKPDDLKRIDLNQYNGFYIELYWQKANLPFYTTNDRKYQGLEIVKNNSRFKLWNSTNLFQLSNEGN